MHRIEIIIYADPLWMREEWVKITEIRIWLYTQKKPGGLAGYYSVSNLPTYIVSADVSIHNHLAYKTH